MSEEDPSTRFARDGYVVIPKLLSTDEVADMRALIRTWFDTARDHACGDTDSLVVDVFRRFPAVRAIAYKPGLLAMWRTLLGDDFVILRETSVHLNRFGGWHADTTSQERAGLRFQWEPDFRMVQTGIYLQDNSPTWAGGLDVVPGSHTRAPRRIDDLIRRMTRGRAGARLRADQVVTVPTAAGDAVLFDFRVRHRASQPTPTASAGAPDKLAIFIAASRRNSHVDAYHDYAATRDDYPWLHQPYEYPHDILQQAREHGLTLA